MVPRTEMVAVPAVGIARGRSSISSCAAGHDACLSTATISTTWSVCCMRSRDVLPVVRARRSLDIVELAREALTVPETVTADSSSRDAEATRTPWLS